MTDKSAIVDELDKMGRNEKEKKMQVLEKKGETERNYEELDLKRADQLIGVSDDRRRKEKSSTICVYVCLGFPSQRTSHIKEQIDSLCEKSREEKKG